MRSAGLLLVLGLACLVLAAFPRVNPAVDAAQKFNQDVALASGAAYISLRAINAALSMAQEVEVGGSLGVSGNLKPLKWLEPVDDTVEKASSTIFAVAVVTGVLSLAMGPISAIGFLLLAAGLLGRCGCELAKARASPAWLGVRIALRRCVGVGLGPALGVPLAFALGGWLGEILTGSAVAEADAALERVAGAARGLIGEPGADGESPGWREVLGSYRSAAGQFWDEADSLLHASLTLVGVFVLRTVVLPLVLIAVLLQILRMRPLAALPAGDGHQGTA